MQEPYGPRLAYGFWRYGEHEADTALTALERVRALGIDHLDTADIYGARPGDAEQLLGALRRRAPSLFDGAMLATKAGVELGTPYNSSDTHLTQACEASLVRLGVERIDLFYVHRPDLLAHPADVAATLDKLVAQGKVAAIGVSNFAPHQVDALNRYLKTPLSALQLELSAAHIEPMLSGALDQAMRDRLHVYGWSPLAGGRLLANDDDLAAVRAKLEDIAAKRGMSLETAALAFLFAHPAAITPIIGTKNPQRITACAEARAVLLSRSEWYAILEARLGRPLP